MAKLNKKKRFDFEKHKDEIIGMYVTGCKISKIMDAICDNYGCVIEESVLRKKLKEWGIIK